MKTCTKCKIPKEDNDDNFAWKNKARGRRHGHCKTCQSGVSKKHYSENKEEYISRAEDRYNNVRAENEAALQAYLEDKACEFCDATDPKILDFIHRPDTEKKGTIRRLLSQAWSTVLAELAKCRIVCANCRRRRGLR